MRTWERDGMTISKMTLGTVQLGMPYGIANRGGQPDERGSFALLDEAVRGGVVSFDTAQAYGESEDVLGRYFGGGEHTIITKIVLDADAAASAGELERQLTGKVERSLRRLKLDRIPLLLLHHASDLPKFGEPLVKACARLVRSGSVGKMGVSFGADPERHTREIWSYARHPVFEAVQVPLNALDHRLLRGGLLKAMGEAGKIVFARSVFLQGLFFLEASALPEKLKPAALWIGRLRRLADREGMTPAELAVAFVRDLPQVHSLVIGAETAAQVKANIGLMNAPALTEEARDELSRAMSDVPERIISPHLWQR